MKTIIPIDIVTLGEKNSYHLFVTGTINGKKYDLLIDTGASQTVFDATLIPASDSKQGKEQKIQSAGINAGELQTAFGDIGKFKMGELKYKDWRVVLIDLTHVNDLYKRFSKKRVAGLLGSDFLLRHKAIIDYKRKELLLRGIKM